MKSKNLIILCIWSGITIIFAFLIVVGASYVDNPWQWLIWMFENWWIVFLVALIFTGAVLFFKKEPEIELQTELQSIVSKLDELTRDIEAIKKAIEE